VPEQDLSNPDIAGRDVRLTLDDGLALMQKVPELGAFTPTYVAATRARSHDRTSTPYLLAVGTSYQEVVNHWVGHGRFFTALDMSARARVCLIGGQVAKDLRLGERPLGQDIQVAGNVFTIVGVMEEKGEFLGQNRDDLVIIPFATARDIYGEEALKRIRLDFKARRAEDVQRAKELMAAVLRDRHGVRPGMRDDFRIMLQEEILKTTSTILGTVTKVIGAVVGVALLVGGIGIMNIMLVTVRERTREIGIRKAVGARRRDVLLQFLIEAATLAGLGGAIGIAAGWALGALGAHAIPGFPTAHMPLWAVVLGFGFASAVGIFFGVYPAAKAASINPIEALRYE
jgi:putative ABC transport system permease protein